MIQVGNRKLKEIKTVNFLPQYGSKCQFRYCTVHISPNSRHSLIYDVKGELSLVKTFTKPHVIIYQMKQPKDKSSVLNLTRKILKGSLKSTGLISSVAIKISTQRSHWIDITVKNEQSTQYSTVQHLHVLKLGLNTIPSIIDYGPTFFSNADISLKFVHKRLKFKSLKIDIQFRT